MPRVWRYPVPRSARPAAAAVASAVAANARAPSFARNQNSSTAQPSTSPSCGQQPLHRPGGSSRSSSIAGRPFPFWGGLFGTCLWVAPIVAIDGGQQPQRRPRRERVGLLTELGVARPSRTREDSAPQRLTLPKLLTYTPSIAKGRRAPYISRAQAMLATSAAGSVHIETGKVS